MKKKTVVVDLGTDKAHVKTVFDEGGGGEGAKPILCHIQPQKYKSLLPLTKQQALKFINSI